DPQRDPPLTARMWPRYLYATQLHMTYRDHGTASARDTLPHLLARRGLRLTGPRRAVLDVLASRHEPLTLAEIHEHLGDQQAHLVSVYRTVQLLVRLHLVRPTDSVRPTDAARGSRRYELAEQFTGHHHHLICQGCGRIEDLEGCVVAESALTR